MNTEARGLLLVGGPWHGQWRQLPPGDRTLRLRQCRGLHPLGAEPDPSLPSQHDDHLYMLREVTLAGHTVQVLAHDSLVYDRQALATRLTEYAAEQWLKQMEKEQQR